MNALEIYHSYKEKEKRKETIKNILTNWRYKLHLLSNIDMQIIKLRIKAKEEHKEDLFKKFENKLYSPLFNEVLKIINFDLYDFFKYSLKHNYEIKFSNYGVKISKYKQNLLAILCANYNKVLCIPNVMTIWTSTTDKTDYTYINVFDKSYIMKIKVLINEMSKNYVEIEFYNYSMIIILNK